MRHHIRLPLKLRPYGAIQMCILLLLLLLRYIYTRSSVIGGRTLPEPPEGMAGGACTADRGKALATLKPRPNRH